MKSGFKFLIYQSLSENVMVNAVIKDETIWLNQKAMAELFGVQNPAISKHLRNIFAEGELDESVVVPKMETTTTHAVMPSCSADNISLHLKNTYAEKNWMKRQLPRNSR